MNPFTPSLSLHSLYEELTEDLKTNPNYNIEDDVLHEFKSNTASEIGTNGVNGYGIYLTFKPNEKDNHTNFYDELYQHWPSFIKPLKDYLESLFSENTNNDACQFDIQFNTNHNDTSNDEDNYWEITINVTDYLS